jgi:5-methyltetrahydropteroyltriglutamate--homocysteine methyltransferase
MAVFAEPQPVTGAVGVLETTVVGSYPQPNWLIDREALGSRVPRVRAPEIWRVAAEFLDEAQDDATLLAIRDMELAGIDIISDGEMRRESYSNRFATALAGVDIEHPGSIVNRIGKRSIVPRIVGPIRRTRAVEVADVEFLRRNTERRIKITLPGPFTMSQQVQDDYYGDDEALAMALADAVNAEVRELRAAGADVIQLDEPWLEARTEAAARFGVACIDRALAGIDGTTVVHVCFGYAAAVASKAGAYAFLPELASATVSQISLEAAQPGLDLSVLGAFREQRVMLGVIDLGSSEVETPEVVAARIRAALAFIAPERLVVAPDCGMKYLPRDRAFAKLCALSRGAAIVRREITGKSS